MTIRRTMAENINVADYFQVVLPALLRWKGPAASAVGKNVRFVVTGPGGGTWTIRLRPPVAGVVEGADWGADLIVKIRSDEMENIIRGTFDARRAISEGNIELAGELGVLKRVAFLFQGGGSSLDVRSDRAES